MNPQLEPPFIGPPLIGFCERCKVYSDLLLQVRGEESKGYLCSPCRGIPESDEQKEYRAKMTKILINDEIAREIEG